jgi:hypothetical protein
VGKTGFRHGGTYWLLPIELFFLMAKIAIIGTEGAGKTVFLSVLAMRCRSPASGQAWLEWKTSETQRYVAHAWDTLQNQDWPPSTPTGTFRRLEWMLHTSDGKSHSLRVFDPAGQDIRAIFESAESDLTNNQKELKQILNDADVVLFLVNLREVIDAPTQRQKDEIEIPLKLAVEVVCQRGVPTSLVFTQLDSYEDLLTNAENSHKDPRTFFMTRYLPQLFGFLSTKEAASSSKVDLHAVAAVSETVPIMDDAGKTHRRPKKDFKSEGVIEVLDWINGAVTRVAQPLKANYYVSGDDGKEYGPYSVEQIWHYVSKNQINAKTLIRSDKNSAWALLGAVPEFMSIKPSLPELMRLSPTRPMQQPVLPSTPAPSGFSDRFEEIFSGRFGELVGWFLVIFVGYLISTCSSGKH